MDQDLILLLVLSISYAPATQLCHEEDHTFSGNPFLPFD